MTEEEGTCQEEAVDEEEEEEQNPPSALSATVLSSLVMAMQSLALCPGEDGVQPRDTGLPGNRRSSELGGRAPLRGTAQGHARQRPKGDSLSLGLKNGNNRRCRRRRGRRRRRSISPCTMRAIANMRRTTCSARLQEFWRLKIRTCLTEK
ncbi:unnamed protein product [Coccothraustes coccothraustes]